MMMMMHACMQHVPLSHYDHDDAADATMSHTLIMVMTTMCASAAAADDDGDR